MMEKNNKKKKYLFLHYSLLPLLAAGFLFFQEWDIDNIHNIIACILFYIKILF